MENIPWKKAENVGDENPRGIYAAPQMQAALGWWLPCEIGQIPDGGSTVLPESLCRLIASVCAEARGGGFPSAHIKM